MRSYDLEEYVTAEGKSPLVNGLKGLTIGERLREFLRALIGCGLVISATTSVLGAFRVYMSCASIMERVTVFSSLSSAAA